MIFDKAQLRSPPTDDYSKIRREVLPPPPAHFAVFKATAIYFTLVFGAGFVFGTLRMLLVVPLIGERLAALYESPMMLIVTLIAAWWVSDRFCRGFGRLQLAAVGLLAVMLVLAAEFVVGVVLRGQSPAQVVAGRDLLSALVYYGLLGLFAAMPWLFARRRSDSSSAAFKSTRP